MSAIRTVCRVFLVCRYQQAGGVEYNKRDYRSTLDWSASIWGRGASSHWFHKSRSQIKPQVLGGKSSRRSALNIMIPSLLRTPHFPKLHTVAVEYQETGTQHN